MTNDDTWWEPPFAGTEAEHLVGARERLALVEDQTIGPKLSGTPLGAPWDTRARDTDPDWDFSSAASDTPEQLYEPWDSTVERSRATLDKALAEGGPDQPIHISLPDGTHPSRRWLLCDLIEEYGRHTGHTDLIREAVHGRVGEDPPAGWRPVSNRPSPPSETSYDETRA